MSLSQTNPPRFVRSFTAGQRVGDRRDGTGNRAMDGSCVRAGTGLVSEHTGVGNRRGATATEGKHTVGKHTVAGRVNRRGAILLMVLGLIVLTAFVVERFLESALRQMQAQATGSPVLDLRLAASSGLQVALAAISELNELDGGLYGAGQGWGDPVAYAGNIDFGGGVTVRVQVVDEGGRIGLNPPNREQMQWLLTQMNVSQWEHEALLDSLEDWIDTDNEMRLNGAEEDYYIRSGSARLPLNEPLRSYEDFRYIKGWSELLFNTDGSPNVNYALLTATTSLRQSGGNSLNLNSAPAAVRYLLAEQRGLDARALEEHIAGDDRIFGTADDKILRNAGELGLAAITAPDGTGFTPGLLRVEVEASRGASRLLLSVLLQSSGNSGQGGSGNRQNSAVQNGGGQGSGSGSDGGQGSGSGGGSGQGGGGSGSGQSSGGSGGRNSGSGGSSGSASPGNAGTLGGFTVVEYAENMVIE